MHIAVIHGQHHKGSTWHVAQMLADALRQPGDTVAAFYVNDLSPCAGCFACITRDETLCPHRAAVGPIIEAIEAADLVVAASPNYCMGMSGQLKILCDHMAYRWMSHRPHPSMKRKIGVAIATTAGVGAGTAAKQIARQMFWWGMARTYRLPFAVAAMGWTGVKDSKKAALAKRVNRAAARIRKAAGKARPGIKSKFMFNMMRAQQKGNRWNPADRAHWVKNGWIREK